MLTSAALGSGHSSALREVLAGGGGGARDGLQLDAAEAVDTTDLQLEMSYFWLERYHEAHAHERQQRHPPPPPFVPPPFSPPPPPPQQRYAHTIRTGEPAATPNYTTPMSPEQPTAGPDGADLESPTQAPDGAILG